MGSSIRTTEVPGTGTRCRAHVPETPGSNTKEIHMKRHLRLAPVAVAAALVLAACGGAAEETAAGDANVVDEPTMEESMAPSEEPMDTESSEPATEMAAGPVGPGCAGYVEAVPEGAGSVEGMTQDPVAVAASNNPLLTTLTAAVSGGVNPDVNLVDTLNGGEFTVFAPVDEAFAADVDAATLETLSTDADLLSSILTYHVIPGQISPEDIAGTTQTSVQGGSVEITGEADNLMVNGNQVICGGVQTANATVYLIDGVLMPTS